MPIGIKPVDIPSNVQTISNGYVSDDSYETKKNRRILVQGIIQAVVQSPIVAGLGYTDEATAVAKVKSVSLELIKFAESQF